MVINYTVNTNLCDTVRKGIAFFLAGIVLSASVSCAPTKAVSTDNRDGMSYETAIIVKSIEEEYKWIAEKYPGSKVQMQALVDKDGVPYDVLTFLTADGEKKVAHFDISKFFGKGMKLPRRF